MALAVEPQGGREEAAAEAARRLRQLLVAGRLVAQSVPMPPSEDVAERLLYIARKHGWNLSWDSAKRIAEAAQAAIQVLGTAAAGLAVLLSEARRPLSFSALHEMYSALRGWEVDKKTVERILGRLVRAGLVAHEKDGPYAWALPVSMLESEAVLRRVVHALYSPQSRGGLIGNFKRLTRQARQQQAPQQQGQQAQRQGSVLSRLRREFRLPASVEKALERIEELRAKGRSDVAIAYLAHTLLPLRKSGALVYFDRDGTVLYYERKTNKLHVVSSRLVAELLQELGLRPGLVDWMQLSGGEREAAKYLEEDFGGYQSARHVHYHLKQWLSEVVAKRDPDLAREALSFPLEGQAVFAYVAPSAILLLPASAAAMLYGQAPLSLQLLLSSMPPWLRQHFALCPSPPCDMVQALSAAAEEARRGLGQPVQLSTREHEDLKNEGRYFS